MMIPLRYQKATVFWTILFSSSLAIAACSVSRPARTHDPETPDCLLLPTSEQPSDTLSLVVDIAIEEREAISYPMAFGELLYAQLYENLFTIDCSGRRHPSLASSWTRSDNGREWHFEIAEGSSFRDGSPITAALVAERLSWNLFDAPSIDSIRVTGDGHLDVYTRAPLEEAPAVLASPLFSVVLPGRTSDWPIGTSEYSISSGSPRSAVLSPTPLSSGPVLRVNARAGDDERDLLAQGVDLMVTTNRDVIRYARTIHELDVVPLPYNVAYILVSTTRFIQPSIIANDTVPSGSAWNLFTGGAVRSDVREPSDAYWWQNLDGCGITFPITSGGAPRPTASFYASGRRRIIYDSSDLIAKDLAERMVALSLVDQGSDASALYLADNIPGFSERSVRLTTSGLAYDDLGASLRSGDDFAYVIPLTIRPHESCMDAMALLGRVPWLGGRDSDIPLAVLPLVETRSYLIARDNHPALSHDWFGSIIFGKRSDR